MTNTKQQAVWQRHPDYPFIEANQFGEVRTIDRVIVEKSGKKRHLKGHVLKQYDNGHGYLYISVTVNSKTIHLYVHRIIAGCFLPNPDKLPEVNHIDNDPTNNAVLNLEWCTSQYNTDHREKYGVPAKESSVLKKPIFAINLETFKVLQFEGQREAERQLGFSRRGIYRVIKGEYNQTHGWWFINANENAIEKTREKFGDEVASQVKKLMSDNCD